ncbi:MAG: right-handed parallel beta-helix repeat-containing protein, partial [Gaiellaceae bacterium]
MTTHHRRRGVRAGTILTACLVVFLGQACGGGSSGSSSDGTNNGGGTPPPSNATATPRPTNTRTSATPSLTQPSQHGTPTPTQHGAPTPSPTSEVPTEVPTATPAQVTIFSGESIADAAKRVPDGGIVVVAPGTYRPVVLNPGDLQGSVTIFADVTGEFTNSPAAPVTISAGSNDEAAFKASGQSGLAIDGLTLRGGRNAGFLCAGCDTTSVLDCTISGSQGDGVRFESSQDALVFNNLLTGNTGAGVRGLGTTNLQIVNNTIYKNHTNGVSLVPQNQSPSTSGYLRNNILNTNTPSGIFVDPGPPSSLDGFDGDFNLNTDGYS